MKPYWQKLKDPRWQKKRLKVLELNDFKCNKCGDVENELHVHHPAYIKGREPWEYDDDELLCLCNDCHKSEHFEIDVLTSVLNDMKLHVNMYGTSNMQAAGLLTAYCHDGPLNLYIYDNAFASGVSIFFHKTEEEVVSEIDNHGEIPYEVIARWKKEVYK